MIHFSYVLSDQYVKYRYKNSIFEYNVHTQIIFCAKSDEDEKYYIRTGMALAHYNLYNVHFLRHVFGYGSSSMMPEACLSK